MNIKPLIAIAALLVSGAANADGCQIQSVAADIVFDAMTPSSLVQTDYGMVQITCEPGTEYIMEIQNAQPGGVIMAVGANPGNALPVYLTTADTDQAIGQATYGEGVSGVGTGSSQNISIRATVGVDHVPVVDTYQAQADIVLLF